MTKTETALLQKLIEKAGKVKWGGWLRRACWGWKFGSHDPSQRYDTYVVGFATIFNDSLLRVEIRLFYAVPQFGFEKFNRRKHLFVLELRIIDDLNRFNTKYLLNLFGEDDSGEKDMLMKIFEKARRRAIFFDRRDLKKREIGLRKIFRLI